MEISKKPMLLGAIICPCCNELIDIFDSRCSFITANAMQRIVEKGMG